MTDVFLFVSGSQFPCTYHAKVHVTQAAEMMDIGEVLDSITPATKKYAPARPGHGETQPPSKSFRQVGDLRAVPNASSPL